MNASGKSASAAPVWRASAARSASFSMLAALSKATGAAWTTATRFGGRADASLLSSFMICPRIYSSSSYPTYTTMRPPKLADLRPSAHPARATTNRRPRRWCTCRPLSRQAMTLSA